MAGAAPRLTEDMVRNTILTWYHGTNEHLPVEQIEPLLAPDVQMVYPNRPEPFLGRQAFRDWYADVLTKYFDETHAVESWKEVAIEDSQATAVVVVRWEARSWELGTARSEYRAHLSRQRFHLARRDDGRVEITAKIVESFDATVPIYGVGA